MTYLTHALRRSSFPRRRFAVWKYLDLYRQRRSLADLDPHLLADIGITETEADAESRRPVWDAPAHWQR